MKLCTVVDFHCHTCNVILKSLLTLYLQFQHEKQPQAIHYDMELFMYVIKHPVVL